MPEQKQKRVKLVIEYRPISELKPYANNARTHSEEQIDAIARSMDEFGWTNPLLVDRQSGVIAGHARLAAAIKRGMDRVPCIELGHLTPAQRRALVIADNQLGLRAGWNIEMLRFELSALKDAGFDLAPLGFELADLASILDTRPVGATDPDEAPELPADPVAIRGDLWALGRHRLICGDATSAEDVGRLFDGIVPNLCVTDPPYGVNYDPAWREGADLGIGKRSKGKVANDDRADWREAWALFPGHIAYVWHAILNFTVVQQSLESQGFTARAQIVWVKQHFVLSRGDYHWQHESCLYLVRGKGNWTGDRKQTTVWEIKNNNSFGNPDKEQTWGHGTQKPVECHRRPILNNSRPGDWIYDPFLGSGTTLIAAEMTGRKALGIEIEPAYVSMAIERWQNFTGKEAVLVGTNMTYAQVKEQRHPGKRILRKPLAAEANNSPSS